MRNKFFQHYILSDKEHIKNIWNDSLIVLDANVLLNLYRYSEETKDRLFDVLEHYKNRLWIPYQVGWEYHQNRISVYTDMNAAYDQISDAISKETSKFINGLNLSKYSRHPKIDTKWFENQIKVFMSGLQDKLHSMKDSSVDYSIKDEINERITELLDGKVGDDFDAVELKDTYKEGQIRYSEKIPPGYCDAKEKKDQGNRHLYGDLIWWKQVLKEAHKRKSNVILITDDVKEDWYHRVGGKTIGPRKELLKEFRATTQMDVLIYPTPKFLEYAKENMSVSVDQNTISEANDIQRENEAIGDVMSSISEENEEEVIKIFSENPWMSAESFLQSYLKPFENPSTSALKYSDILGKDYLNPLENLTRLTSDHPALFGKTALNPVEDLATATTKISDILGKDYLSTPLESIARLTPDHSAIFGKSALNPVEGLATATTTRISDILGEDYLRTPLESIARLTPGHPALFGKSALNPIEGLATATTRISDILGKDYFSNPLESIARLTPGYSAILGKSVLNTDGGVGTRFSGFGIHDPTTSSERKDDKSANK